MTITSVAAHFSLPLSHTHLSFNQTIALDHIESTHIPLPTLTLHFTLDFQIRPKCLPKPLRRNPPLVARRQPVEKPPRRRRRQARRPQRPPVIRRSATRRERKPTPRTSTKVRSLRSRHFIAILQSIQSSEPFDIVAFLQTLSNASI